MSDRLLWCNSHQRKATAVDAQGRPQCDPMLGGILLPCRVVDLTEECEIEDEEPTPTWVYGEIAGVFARKLRDLIPER